jgi:hypothetical protein
MCGAKVGQQSVPVGRNGTLRMMQPSKHTTNATTTDEYAGQMKQQQQGCIIERRLQQQRGDMQRVQMKQVVTQHAAVNHPQTAAPAATVASRAHGYMQQVYCCGHCYY